MIEMLRRVLCFIDAKPPSTKMSNFFPLLSGFRSIWVQLQDYTVLETTEVVVARVRNMVRQRDLLFEWLEVATEGAEALKLDDGKKEAIYTKADKLRKEGRPAEVKLKEVE
ncbi:hypothetical protein CK203_091336 [Vitis vinifera]|uniref:Uncharacterized protein n=1 Tax=Vitis vinifera TaxID=29760 RepID=A0A438CLK5_VITVI|nr:hypothetical protein CK203_091336 [Vitis vinifera]